MARTTIPSELVAINAIQGTLIADNAITAVHIATNAVSGTLIADNAVTSTHIAQNHVTGTQISQNTITVTHLADNAVETAKINASAVTTAKINNGAVTADKLAANSVTSAKIVNGTIVAADLADDAVTIAKMAALARGKIIYGDSSGAPAALALGSNGQVLKSDGTDIAWATLSTGVDGISSSADATAITIDSSERVGIGVGSPSAKLQVDGEVRIQSSTEDGTSLFSIYNENTNPDSEQFFIAMNGSSVEMGNARGNALDFFTSDTRRMRITSGGYVGVGTTSPQGELHLVGATGAPVRLYLSDVDDGTGAGDSLLITKSGATAYIYNRDDGDLRLGTNDDNDMLTIDSTGKIGIGTNSPSSHLHIESASSPTVRIKDTTNDCTLLAYAQDSEAIFGTYSNHTLSLYANSSAAVTILGSGNVGIGDTTPAHKLEVGGSIGLSGALELASAAMIDWANGDARILEGATNNYDLQFQTYDGSACSTKLTIQGGGNIGIGTTSPSGKLDIHTVDTSAYSATGEPVETALIHNESGADGTGVNYYSTLALTTGAGATSQGFINYVRTADNQGKFTFSQRTGSSTYKEAMSIHNDGTMHVGFNEDQQSIFGRTWIGFVSGLSDYAGIGHIDVADSGGYALLQSSGGATFLNAEDGADIYFLNHGTTSMRLSSTGRLGLGVDPSDGLGCQYGIQIKGGNDNYQATNFNESCQLSISTEVNTEGRYAAIRFTHVGNTEGFFGLVRRSATSDITDFVWQMYNGTTNTYQEHARLSSSALLTAAGKDNGAGYGTYGYMTCSTNLSGYTAGDYPTLKTDGNTIHFDANGTYTGYISHNTSFTDISDEREKDTIETISGATALVKQLRGVTHKWKDRRDDKTHYGLIAQEVEKVVPDVVSEGATKVGETEPTKGVAYQKLVPLLIETIKELEARIKTLEG